MDKIRIKFISLMYLIFIVFFVLQKVYVEENLYKIMQYDELRQDLMDTQSTYDCLELKYKVMKSYADAWYEIDWDKAVQIYEQDKNKSL